MLDVKAKAVKNSVLRQRKNDKAYASAADIYAEHSLLASGKWAKIRVSSSGVYQLTDATVRQAGFSNINKVKIYGYGGNLQNEALYANDLARTDDLKEVPQCVVGGKHLFYAKGPVSWTSNSYRLVRRRILIPITVIILLPRATRSLPRSTRQPLFPLSIRRPMTIIRFTRSMATAGIMADEISSTQRPSAWAAVSR